jgi:hypothetical protein
VAKACFDIITPYSNCSSLPLLEEILEALGYTTAAVGMLLFAEQSFPNKQWNSLKWVEIMAVSAWLLICISSYWLQPSFENRFFATPVYANFADSQMILVGYRINREFVTSGDAFTVDLYWRTERIPSHQYGYTINLVNPATGETIVRENTKIIDPTTDAWFTGTTHRTSLTLAVPNDIETPVSPYVIVTLWRLRDDSSIVINPEATDRGVFGEGSPIITELPILSAKPDSSDNGIYNFANGARLLDYTVTVEDDGTVSLSFQWSTTEIIDANLSQMLHIVNVDTAEQFVFDQPPFERAFPTTAWVKDMNEVDTWHIVLSRDAMASGNYIIYTGLYDANGVRVAVTANDGTSVPNNTLAIGEISIEGD